MAWGLDQIECNNKPCLTAECTLTFIGTTEFNKGTCPTIWWLVWHMQLPPTITGTLYAQEGGDQRSWGSRVRLQVLKSVYGMQRCCSYYQTRSLNFLAWTFFSCLGSILHKTPITVPGWRETIGTCSRVFTNYTTILTSACTCSLLFVAYPGAKKEPKWLVSHQESFHWILDDKLII